MAKLIYNGMEIADVTYTSGGGGGELQEVLTDGVVSTTADYATANFDETPNTDYIAISFKVSGVEQTCGTVVKVSELSSTEIEITAQLEALERKSLKLRITDSYIRGYDYFGSWVNITATIRGYDL